MSALREAAQQALEAWDGDEIEWFKRGFTVMENLRAALAQQAESVQPGAWVASKDGRVIYDDSSTDDSLLRVSGDFEDDEQRVRYAKQIVDKLNAAPAQRTMVPLTEEEIYHTTGHCGVSKYTAINIARAVEQASWEKNHGQA